MAEGLESAIRKIQTSKKFEWQRNWSLPFRNSKTFEWQEIGVCHSQIQSIEKVWMAEIGVCHSQTHSIEKGLDGRQFCNTQVHCTINAPSTRSRNAQRNAPTMQVGMGWRVVLHGDGTAFAWQVGAARGAAPVQDRGVAHLGCVGIGNASAWSVGAARGLH